MKLNSFFSLKLCNVYTFPIYFALLSFSLINLHTKVFQIPPSSLECLTTTPYHQTL